MNGYKGYEKGLVCRGKQYAENTVFEEEKAEICESGMHFCSLPHGVFSYYAAGDGHEFTMVEALDEVKTDDSIKYTTKKLRIGAKISVFDICKMSVSAFFEQFDFTGEINKVKEKKGAANAGYKGAANAGDCGAANAGYKGAANAGNYGAANAGDWGAANAGDYGAANAGDWGAANAGDCGAANAGRYGAANAGNYGAANAGDYGAANAGDWGAANAGDCGAANAGNYGAANAGDYGAANAGYKGAANAGYKGAANAGYKGAANAGDWGTAVTLINGSSACGANGIAVARGDESKVKGGLRATLIIQIVNKQGELIGTKMRTVDGKHIKADTWYTLRDGKFVKAE